MFQNIGLFPMHAAGPPGAGGAPGNFSINFGDYAGENIQHIVNQLFVNDMK